MRVAIKKIEGVDDVKVSLNQGLAEVTFKPKNHATLEQVREVVRRNGFTPRGADVKVAGRLVQHEGKPALAVTESDAVYLLAEDPEAKGKLSEFVRIAKDQTVVVSGRAPDTNPQEKAPPTLQLRDFTAVNR